MMTGTQLSRLNLLRISRIGYGLIVGLGTCDCTAVTSLLNTSCRSGVSALTRLEPVMTQTERGLC